MKCFCNSQILKIRLARLAVFDRNESSTSSTTSQPIPHSSSATDSQPSTSTNVASSSASKPEENEEGGYIFQKPTFPKPRQADEVTAENVKVGCDITEKQFQSTTSRVLQCTFKKPAERYIYLPQSTEILKTKQIVPLREMLAHCFKEITTKFACGNNPFIEFVPTEDSDDSSVNSISPASTPSPNLSPSPSATNTCPNIPFLFLQKVESDDPQSIAFHYLLDCYAKVAIEEENHPKRSSKPPYSVLLSELRAQMTRNISWIIRDYIIVSPIVGKIHNSLLLKPLLQQSLPRGFLSELVSRTYQNQDLFKSIFNALLKDLFLAMQRVINEGTEDLEPIDALHELTEIGCCGWPICSLIVEQPYFLPSPFTVAMGREVTRVSYLGPFLSITVFADDDHSVAEQFFTGNSSIDENITHILQQELEYSRTVVYRIFFNIFSNVGSRYALLDYITKVLMYNERRSQMHVEEKNVAGDGFMLNLLSVMQMLAAKVKLDKIDLLYPFHPFVGIDIKNDSRFVFTLEETHYWLEELGKQPFFESN